MSTDAIIIITIVAIVVIGFVVSFVVRKGVDKGADAIEHAIIRKKNAKNETDKPQSLADRHNNS